MSTRNLAGHSLSLIALVAMAQAAFAEPGTARLATYEKGGQSYFALTLMPEVAADPSQKNEVVFLVDTSASQTGRYRAEQMAALQAALSAMTSEDRVMLMAVDMKAVPMSAGFVGAQSPEMQAAVAKLNGRTPLGATDLDAGLRAAASSFSGADAARTIVYVGDAMSRANILTGNELGKLVTDLKAKHAAVSTYVVGQEHNLPLIAAIANQTGGLVQVARPDADVAMASGRVLGASVHSGVIWPQESSVEGSVAAAYPAEVPPLRTDRDTVVIGMLSGMGNATAAVTGAMNGKPVSIAWNAAPERPSEDFAFLPKLVDLAAADRGLTLPTAGSALLREAAIVTMNSAQQLARLGHEALASGNFAGAEKVANAALASDPGNPEATAIKEAARKGLAGARPQPTAEADLKLTSAVTEAPAASIPAPGGLLEEVLAAEPGFLGTVESERRVLSARMRAEVENSLVQARKTMSQNPDQAEQDLKLTLEVIERTPELDPELRGQLRQQVENAVRESRRRKIEVARQLADAEERRAQAQEQERLDQALSIQTQRIKQIVDRFNSLLAERRYDVADQELVPEIERLAPGTPIDSSILHSGRIMRAVAENERQLRLKNDGFLRTLYSVELSFVPFPDEPPVVYLPADQWEDLTLRRQKFKAVDLGRRGGAEEKIFTELNRTTDLDVVEMPLKDVVMYLQEKHNIPIVLSLKKLEEASVNPDTPVTKSLKNVTLRSALRLILKDMELTYVIRDEVLQITTPEDAESQLITKVYPVGDLVIPPGSSMMMGGMMGGGMMGGMGGGMMNGGGMGGGMGGMGGGMGGMGGGMGGMGGGMGGGMFAVEDELTLGTKKPTTPVAEPVAPAAQPSLPAPSKQAAMPAARISAKPAAGETASAAWDRYFAAESSRIEALAEPKAASQALLAAVRETVRQLMDEKKYAEVATLIEAALRHGQMEPWMYEGLALALRADAAEKINRGEKIDAAQTEALERALLSAVDFARDEDQLVMIAAYMSQAGLEQRALSVYRQISKANPSRPEPLLQGLALAQRLNDVAAIQWACVGILSQAWSGPQRELADRAYRVGRATYEQLLVEGRKSEAEAFDVAVRRAQERDCVVVVTWTGDADIDIAVEEPAGTLVNQRQPRSVAGGAHLGDVSAADGKSTTKGFSEAYVCPEGFAGEYKLLVKKVWGRPTSDKVTVEVIKHFGSDRQVSRREQIPLAEKNAVVEFALDAGRRKDALPEAQVASVAKIQNAVNRTLLAQQLGAANNGPAAQGFAGSLASAGQAGFFNPGFFLRGAVGYRPVITQIPEGASLTTDAVLSADRRYVRVSPAPNFSQITEVNTFNFVTGQGAQQQGGGGGGGFGGGGIGGGGFL